MATEYIEKQAALKAVCDACAIIPEDGREDCQYKVDGCKEYYNIFVLQPADVQPVRRGRWIIHYDDIWPTESTQECPECHEEVPLLIDCKFCPNCGAWMEEGDAE